MILNKVDRNTFSKVPTDILIVKMFIHDIGEYIQIQDGRHIHDFNVILQEVFNSKVIKFDAYFDNEMLI